MLPLTWTTVLGGVCRYGDRETPREVSTLHWTVTPITYGQLDEPTVDQDLPITGINQDDAAGIAADLDGRLPTSVEWEWMAAGPERRRYPWGDDDWQPPLARLGPAGHHRPGPVGTHPAGATPDGVNDVAGCVWEWTSTPTMGHGRIIRGGSYASAPLYARCTFLNIAPEVLRSPGIGLRVVRPA